MQRRERQAARAHVIMSAARREAQRKQASPLVKGENLSASVAPELRRDQPQERGLAGAGRPKYKCMAKIAGMEAEKKRRGPVRGQHGQRRRVGRIERTRAMRGPFPY